MSPDFLHALSPMVALVVSMSSQLVGLRNISKLNFYKSVLFGFGWGFLVLLGLEIYFIPLEQGSITNLAAIVFVNFFCYFIMQSCYFLLINMGVSALRVRLLDELYKSDKGLTMEEIIGRYSSKEIVQKRIDKLMAARQIDVKGNRCFINRRSILLIAKIYDCVKLMVFGKRFQRV